MTKDAILIQPIRNEQDHDRAIARITYLMEAELAGNEGDELDMLITLVDWYENQHYPMGTSTPQSTIRVYMDNLGLTRKDLEPMIGTRARVSEVLSGKRRLTLDMIRRLHEGLGIPLEDLISVNIEGLQPAATAAAARRKKAAPKASPVVRARIQAATSKAAFRREKAAK